MEDYQIGMDKIWVTGEPRNDLFFNDLPEQDGRVVSYIATHRYELAGCTNNAFDFFADYQFDAARMNALMEELDATFCMKFHHLHEGHEKVIELFKDYPLLKIYEGEDAFPLLLETDVLISDYSSVFCNFLNLNRPLIFYFFDLDAYRTVQGVTSMLDHPPGPVCMNWDEIEAEIRRAFSDDGFAEQRMAMQKHLYSFNDGRNCERIYEEICALEKKGAVVNHGC